jgi:hypothetical protein
MSEFDSDDLEGDVAYPSIYMESWAGNVILISDAIQRVHAPVQKENIPLYQKHLKAMHGALTKAIKLHNACVEMELELALVKLASGGASKETIDAMRKRISEGTDENHLSNVVKRLP